MKNMPNDERRRKRHEHRVDLNETSLMAQPSRIHLVDAMKESAGSSASPKAVFLELNKIEKR